MRYQRYFSLLFLFTLLSSCLFSQGLNTTASKDDWEEINFEFNSPVLTDGYPSLLRLADCFRNIRITRSNSKVTPTSSVPTGTTNVWGSAAPTP